MRKVKSKKLPIFKFLKQRKQINAALAHVRSYKAVYAVCIFTSVLFVAIFFVPFTFAYNRESVIPISEQKVKTDALELGETKLVQEGIQGAKVTKYERTGTLVNLLLNPNVTKKHHVTETYETKPKNKVISVGTRRYQYMMCTDGRYRYYTDEQMKNKNVGFTSKSADDCAKNNQGVKVKLADSPDGKVADSSYRRTQVSTDPSCHKENIIKFSTTYEDRSYLPTGTSQIGIPGSDGFTLVCPSIPGSLQRTNFPVINEVVYVGTGKTSQQIADEQAEADAIRQQQQLAEQRQEQLLKQTQCIQSLKAQGMTADRAQYECARLYPIP